jgi:hypothetical protein
MARDIYGNIFKNPRVFLEISGLWLILDKNRGLFAKWQRIIGLKLFSNGKRRGLGPRIVDHGQRRSTVDRGQGNLC